MCVSVGTASIRRPAHGARRMTRVESKTVWCEGLRCGVVSVLGRAVLLRSDGGGASGNLHIEPTVKCNVCLCVCVS